MVYDMSGNSGEAGVAGLNQGRKCVCWVCVRDRRLQLKREETLDTHKCERGNVCICLHFFV